MSDPLPLEVRDSGQRLHLARAGFYATHPDLGGTRCNSHAAATYALRPDAAWYEQPERRCGKCESRGDYAPSADDFMLDRTLPEYEQRMFVLGALRGEEEGAGR